MLAGTSRPCLTCWTALSHATALPVQDHPYSHADTLREEADTTTLPMCFIAMMPMSQYGGQLHQEIDSPKNTFHVLEPHVSDYPGHNLSTVVALVLYSQHYHAVSLRNIPCSFLMCLSYPIRARTSQYVGPVTGP